MKNDLAKGLRTRDGRRWTAQTRLAVKARLARWGDLADYARQHQRAIIAGLLRQTCEVV